MDIQINAEASRSIANRYRYVADELEEKYTTRKKEMEDNAAKILRRQRMARHILWAVVEETIRNASILDEALGLRGQCL
ncbi:hypothetical protein MAR_008229 [Mya arenaria]|uniref:Uncharacterized protein n=1 Tax=Mya arenaria TaxID=6604 RepID=A0ABY7DYC3_MYAAR|nr:hypothetical protein MAR_008229 [Mya arenaria]